MTYAGFWKRFGANIADGLVLLLPLALILFLGSFSKDVGLVLVVPLTFLYAAYTLYGHVRWGQTLGKMIAGIRVLRVSGNAIAWREAFLRSVVNVGFAVLTAIASLTALLSYPDADYARVGWIERQQKLGEL